MINNQDDENNIALYSSLFKKYGNNFQALNWGSEQSQKLRFKVLVEIGMKKGDLVLDVGCGLGDLYQWLCENNKEVRYEGLDLTPDMIKSARERFPEGVFWEGTFNSLLEAEKPYDFVVASGIFAHRQLRPQAFLEDTIKGMYDRAIKGVAFNCLSSWREEQEQGEFYADPIETLNYCKKLSNRVVFRHDYHQGDFTIYIYKPGFFS